MKTPTWGYVVGILMLLFGGCSVTKDVQSINTPMILEMQKGFFENFTDEFSTEETDTLKSNNADSTQTAQSDDPDPGKLFGNTMEKMLHMSDFTKKWIVRFGYIGLFVSLIYILGGVFLLVRKPFSLKLAIGALVLSIVFSIIESIVLSSNASGLMAMSAGFSHIFGIMIDVVLIVVILASDRSAYKPENL